MPKKLRNLRELLYKMQMEELCKENQMMDRLSSITNNNKWLKNCIRAR